MSINPHPNHMPVFHHIAKNAGTYVLSWAQMLCRKYHMMRGDNRSWHWTSVKIRRGLIPLIDGRQLTIIYFTPTDLTGSNLGIFSLIPGLEQESKDDKRRLVNAQSNYINGLYPSGGDEVTNIIPEEDFLNFIENGDIIPFCAIVDPIFWGGLKHEGNSSGWKCARIFIDQAVLLSGRKHALNFTVLRNPYDRALSIFNYIKSDNSSHEPNHDCLTSKNFQEYIESYELEDSWFLRNLLDMPDDQIIEPYHLTLAHEWLQYFRISDISGVDILIDSVFHGCYGITQGDVEPNVVATHINKNKTHRKVKYEFSDLPVKTQQTFLDRTYWDRKLWERYCKNVDIS